MGPSGGSRSSPIRPAVIELCDSLALPLLPTGAAFTWWQYRLSAICLFLPILVRLRLAAAGEILASACMCPYEPCPFPLLPAEIRTMTVQPPHQFVPAQETYALKGG